MAWWNREELEAAGVAGDDITALLHASPKTRVWRKRIVKRGKVVGMTPQEVQVWIPKELPLDAAIFIANARLGAR